MERRPKAGLLREASQVSMEESEITMTGWLG